MEAKVFSVGNLIKLSGTTLLILLTLFLVASAWYLQMQQQLIPLLLSAVITAAVGFVVVPILQKLKAGQFIQEDGPQSHLKKAGTPTMGGIFFLPVAVIMALIWSQFAGVVIALSLVTLAYASLGWFDDWQILYYRSNKGISPRVKLSLQIAIATLFCLWMFWTQPLAITNVSLPGNVVLSLGWLFWLLAGFTITAESNAVNLTDGVDGLAGGTVGIAVAGLGVIMAPTHPEIMIFCLCLSGACLGFLVHNRNKATVFMGDTGSLALGGALGAIGLLSGHLWALFIVSGIFFVESLSVIAQVTYYKATKDEFGQGKRLLKMAPLHHHLELSGWSETQVVGAFYLVNVLLVALAIVFS